MDIYEDFFAQADTFKHKLFDDVDTEECAHTETCIIRADEICSNCGITLRQGVVETKTCEHLDTTQLEGNEICVTCGMVLITQEEDDEYAASGSGSGGIKETTRCHKRKTDQRSIYKDVEGMEFPESVVKSANKKYQNIIKNNIYRGSKRKAIIVACLFYSYIEHNEYKTSNEISKKFNIKKKSVKEGFTKYCEVFPDAITQYIDPKSLIKQIMIRANINFSHLKRINKLCEFLENKSPLLNRSNPQSVAAAVVYLYLCLEPEYKEQLGMTKLKFSHIVNLSDITITKLGKESQRIIQNDSIKI